MEKTNEEIEHLTYIIVLNLVVREFRLNSTLLHNDLKCDLDEELDALLELRELGQLHVFWRKLVNTMVTYLPNNSYRYGFLALLLIII